MAVNDMEANKSVGTNQNKQSEEIMSNNITTYHEPSISSTEVDDDSNSNSEYNDDLNNEKTTSSPTVSSSVEFRTMLRIRPFLPNEESDENEACILSSTAATTSSLETKVINKENQRLPNVDNIAFLHSPLLSSACTTNSTIANSPFANKKNQRCSSSPHKQLRSDKKSSSSSITPSRKRLPKRIKNPAIATTVSKVHSLNNDKNILKESNKLPNNPNDKLSTTTTTPNDANIKPSSFSSTSSNFTAYTFDKILDTDATQSMVYNSFITHSNHAKEDNDEEEKEEGDVIKDVLAPLSFNFSSHDATKRSVKERKINHVVVSFGISNSGKTFTMFGDGNDEKMMDIQQNDERSEKERHLSSGISKSTEEEEKGSRGIIPRLLHDLFTQGNNLTKTTSSERKENSPIQFGIRLSMVYLHNEQIYDLLSSTTASDSSSEESNDSRTTRSNNKNKNNGRYSGYSAAKNLKHNNRDHHYHHHRHHHSHRYHSSQHHPSQQQQQHEPQQQKLKKLKINQHSKIPSNFTLSQPQIITSSSLRTLLETIQVGLNSTITSSTHLNLSSSRGHTVVTIQPVLLQKKGGGEGGEQERDESVIGTGGIITILDLAGIERTKKSLGGTANGGTRKLMRESIAINSSVFGVLACLRVQR